MRKRFLAAYAAGKQSVEDRSGWQSIVFAIVGGVLWSAVGDWFVIHYSLPKFESFLLSGGVVFLLGLVFGLVKYGIGSKRSQ